MAFAEPGNIAQRFDNIAHLNTVQYALQTANASPFHVGKSRSREEMLATRARDNRVILTYTNTVGGQVRGSSVRRPLPKG